MDFLLFNNNSKETDSKIFDINLITAQKLLTKYRKYLDDHTNDGLYIYSIDYNYVSNIAGSE